MGTTMPVLSWTESGAGQKKELQDWIGNDCDKGRMFLCIQPITMSKLCCRMP